MSDGAMLLTGTMLGAVLALVAVWGINEKHLQECAKERNVFRCERVVTYQPAEVSP